MLYCSAAATPNRTGSSKQTKTRTKPASIGTSEPALVSWEDNFEVDLNGDLNIGHTLTEIESAGDVVLSSSSTGGFSVSESGGSEIDLTDKRGRLIQQSTRYEFLHAAEDRSGGYDVLVNQPRRGVDSYHVRHFDSTGKEDARSTSIGTSESALLSWESNFESDLNSDFSIGRLNSGSTDYDII